MTDKKELKRQYKETKRPMGIYQIRNTTNGKIFVGRSKELHATFNSDLFQLKNGMYVNRALQEDFTRLGEDRFVFEVVDVLEPKGDAGYEPTEDLKVLERMWIDKLQPYGEKGYHRKAADPGPPAGKQHGGLS